MDPRRLAFEVLAELDKSPRRLEKVLHQALGRQDRADPRHLATATNLVYLVLRNRLYLDHLLSRFVSRPLKKLDPPVLTVLRLGAAQMALGRTPEFAAVSASVDLAKATPARRGQKLINGVLRSFAKGWQEAPLPDAGQAPLEYLSLRHSHPLWMVKELASSLGSDQVEAWLRANQGQPPAAVRVNRLKNPPESLVEILKLACDEVTAHPWFEDSLILHGLSGPLQKAPGFREGLWQGQDPGATGLSPLLGAGPGMRVLDLCAGSGGKTGHLAALMNNQGQLWAVEPSAGRCRALGENLKRLGVTCAKVMQMDGAQLPLATEPFDCILVDAPCTGLGTLGRRPDLRWRKSPGGVKAMAALQLSLLEHAARLLKPGGAMLYATCTFTRAENEQVVKALLAARPNLCLKWPQPAPALVGGDGFFRTLPHLHGCDGFFAARLVAN